MTLREYYKFTLGTSDHLTRCRVLWGGGEIMNDYFSRLGDIGQNIKIRSARYDKKTRRFDGVCVGQRFC